MTVVVHAKGCIAPVPMGPANALRKVPAAVTSNSGAPRAAVVRITPSPKTHRIEEDAAVTGAGSELPVYD